MQVLEVILPVSLSISPLPHPWMDLRSNALSMLSSLRLCSGAKEGVKDLTRKIEVLGKGQAVDWKQAYREVDGYFRELIKIKLEEQQKKGMAQTLKTSASHFLLPPSQCFVWMASESMISLWVV